MANNVLVEDIHPVNATGFRERAMDAQSVESINARYEQLGPFRQDNPPATQALTAQTLAATDAVAPTSQIAPRSGTIVGICASSNAALTAGTATFRASKNAVVQGTGAAADSVILALGVQKKVTELVSTSFISFVAGDLLGIQLTTSAAYLPITADHQSYLMVRWSPALT
jgi:hypothetical protein